MKRKNELFEFLTTFSFIYNGVINFLNFNLTEKKIGVKFILSPELSRGLSVRVRIKVCVKLRNDAKFKTIPKDIIKDCNLDKNVYGLLREFEKKGVIEAVRNGNKYSDIRLTKKGLQQLSEKMLAPYRSEIRDMVLRIDDGSASKLEIDENLIKFVSSVKPELKSFFREFIVREYSTVIPTNFPDVFSPELDRFFDNKFVNLNKISQN